MKSEQMRWMLIEPKLMEDIQRLVELTSEAEMPSYEEELMAVLRSRIAEAIAEKVESGRCYEYKI